MHTLMSLVEGAGMTLEVASTNAKAIRLYEKLGFLRTAEKAVSYTHLAVVLVREIEIRYANGAGSPTLFSAMQTFDIVTGSCISGFDFGHCTHNIFSFLVILCLSSMHYETPYMI